MAFMMAHDGQEGVLFLPQAFHASAWKSRGSQNSTIPPNETVQVNKDYFDKVALTELFLRGAKRIERVSKAS